MQTAKNKKNNKKNVKNVQLQAKGNKKETDS